MTIGRTASGCAGAMALAAMMAGLSGRRKPPAPAAAAAPEAPKDAARVAPNEDVVVTALRKLERDLTVERRGLEAIVYNKGAYETSLEALERRNRQLRVAARIPEEPAGPDGELAEALVASGQKAGVTVKDVVTRRVAAERRAVPETVSKAFDWRETDLRDVIQVSLRLEADTRLAAKRWYTSLPIHLDRLLYVRTMSPFPGGWTVTAEAYVFRRVAVPRDMRTARPLAERMTALGIAESDARTEATRGRLATCRGLQAAVEALIPKVNEALLPLTVSHYGEARWRFFASRVETIRKVDIDRLLAGPDTK